VISRVIGKRRFAEIFLRQWGRETDEVGRVCELVGEMQFELGSANERERTGGKGSISSSAMNFRTSKGVLLP